MARRLVILYHDDFKNHDPMTVKHPENPGRLDIAFKAITDMTSSTPRGKVRILGAPRGSIDVFKSVHDPLYVERVKNLLRLRRLEWVDRDTYVSRGSLEAISRLVGASQKSITLALRGISSFILGRPPSHHAGVKGKAMGAPSLGFCLFNATALIASILSRHGRVAIVDFDVHHGNGTQEIFYSNPHILHVDVHVDPSTSYPGTGYPYEVGEGEAMGTKVNIVTPVTAGDDIYMSVIEVLDVILDSWRPEYMVVSAGFDAYRGDNDMVLTNVGTRFYYHIGKLLASKAKAVISVLEGGYGVGLDRALKAYIAGLLGLREWLWDPPSYSNLSAWKLYWTYINMLYDNITQHGKISLPEWIIEKVKARRRRKLGFRIRRRLRRYRRYI